MRLRAGLTQVHAHCQGLGAGGVCSALGSAPWRHLQPDHLPHPAAHRGWRGARLFEGYTATLEKSRLAASQSGLGPSIRAPLASPTEEVIFVRSPQELSFTWVGFIAAMGSNLSSALRGILAKKTMGGGVGENMTEANIYAVLTILATIFILPISFALEPPSAVMSCINAALAQGFTPATLWKHSLLAGAFYYLYNEVAFLALGRVNPVTHAVGNTIKRVVIIIASVIAFKTPISTLGVIGSSIAIAGTLLYSLAKSKFG
eukprot:Transcript_30070.p1 GENE.Transcript_30070~~Transcript_30070.p1  ORF type:complete len:260 (-),score=68.38 Transcript_30070:1011-1790(-)